ncbi:MAG: PAS domain S-box protein [Syntrophus sp. (in: bacteria)]
MTDEETGNYRKELQMTTASRRSPTTSNAIFHWRSLKTRVTIFTLAFFLVGIWSLAFYASQMLREDMQRTLGEQQFSTVSIVAAEINAGLDDRMRALEQVAALITPAMLGNAATMQTFIEGRTVLKMMFNGGIFVLLHDGTAIADFPLSTGRRGLNFMDRKYAIGALKEGKTTIGSPVMGKALRSTLFSIATPIHDTKGKVIGTLTGTVDLAKPNFLSRITDNSYGKTGGYLLVAPETRTIVYATDKKRIMEVLPGPGLNPLIDRAMKGWEGSDITVRPSNGVEILSSAKGVPVSGWYTAAIIPTAEAFAPIRAMQKRMLLATIFLTMLAGGLTWWILKRQLEPVFTTIKALATLSNTDQPMPPLPITRQDEIGELIGGFNHLLDTLRQRGDALKESEGRFRKLADAGWEGLVFHKDGILIDANESFLKMFGYSSEEIIGKSVLMFLAPESVELAVHKLKEFSLGDQSYFEAKGLRKDKTIFSIELKGRPIRYKDLDARVLAIRDITDRKQAEEALRVSETSSRTLIENSFDVIFTLDAEGTFLFVSPAWERHFGYPVSEVIGGNFASFMHPDDVEPCVEYLMAILVTGNPGTSPEYRVKHANGSWRWFIANGSTYVDLKGQRQFVGTGRDITERKRMEAALRESELKYRLLIEGSSDAIFCVDEIGQYKFANQVFAATLGKSPDYFNGKTFWDVYPKEHADYRYEATKRVFQTGKSESLEVEVPLPTETLYFYATTNPIKDEKGKVILNLTHATDITQQKLAENALRESEEKFFKAFKTSPYAITITHPEDGNFIEVNDAFTTMTGFTREEALADSSIGLKLWVNEDDRQRVVADLRAGRAVVGQEIHFRTKRDEIITGLFSAQTIQLINGPCILSSINDISERKRTGEEKAKLEGQLQQAQKMESVGRLAGGVAHDFNNLLGVILGHAEMALDQVDKAEPIHADLEEIRKAANRSADLTRQLLAFARQQVVSPKVLDLNDTVEGMLKLLRRLIGEDINLSWKPGASLWPIKIDPSQIDQILANICVNARDAISDVGKMTIETENSAFDNGYCADHVDFVPGEYVLLTLRDDGCGMNKETLSHLFEPFFTTKAVGKGTGLGLATVYGIVKQNKGFINVYSEPDQGTTFRIYLPRHVGKATQMQREAPAESVARGHETILLVEDEKTLLDLSKYMLEKQGYRVLTAGTPGEAIRLAEEKEGEIQLLMTDVVMPEMNGRDLAKKMLSLYPNLKCLFTSGYTANVIAHHGVLDEDIYFIQKPFSRRDLAAKIREVLDQE